MFTLNGIDYSDTTGRVNKGKKALIGRLSFTASTSTEVWLKEVTLGTYYCGFVGADFNLAKDKIIALFFTDGGTQPFSI